MDAGPPELAHLTQDVSDLAAAVAAAERGVDAAREESAELAALCERQQARVERLQVRLSRYRTRVNDAHEPEPRACTALCP